MWNFGIILRVKKLLKYHRKSNFSTKMIWIEENKISIPKPTLDLGYWNLNAKIDLTYKSKFQCQNRLQS